jgi:hypothetical protein
MHLDCDCFPQCEQCVLVHVYAYSCSNCIRNYTHHTTSALSLLADCYWLLQILKKVEGEVQQLRVVLDGARKRGHERVWLNNQVCSLSLHNC